MPVAAAIVVGAASIGGAAISADASRRAAHTAADAANAASGTQTQLTDTGIQAAAQMSAPWRNIGAGALYQLADLLGIDPRTAFPNGQGHQRQGQPQGNTGGVGQDRGRNIVTPNVGYGGQPAQNTNPPAGMIPKAGTQSKSLLGDIWHAVNPVDIANRTVQSVTDLAHGDVSGAIRNGPTSTDPTGLSQRLVDTKPGMAVLNPLSLIPGANKDPAAPGGGGAAAPAAGTQSLTDLLGAYPTPGAPDANFGSLLKPFGADTFQKDPGYDFRRREGQKGVENSAAARGMQLSGAALKGIDRYNQDFASNEYSNAYNRYTQDQTNEYNRLSNLAGMGQTSAQQVGNTASSGLFNLGSQIGANTIGAGNANAAGVVGQANAITGGLNNLSNAYLQQYELGQLFGTP